ncbi:MAG: cytochrome c oxidase accessory protein CcoG [bacterium]
MTNQTSKSAAAKADAQVEHSLYAKHEKVYPRQVSGLFARMRLLGVLSLLGIYYFTPLLRWDGQQAVLFDLPNRKFHIFGLTLWPQDFIYLAALLIVAGLTLFFVTALAGRIWCGYSCPQTVWTEAFLWMERLVEGDRPKQIKLDKAPMSFNKFRIKATKHALWILFSFWTGFIFVGYFTPVDELFHSMVNFSLGPWETFWVFFYGFATYGNAGWMREQVCKYMCPYARFQSAMFDADTLIIDYDEKRGDPRGKRKKSANPKELGLGDCIDCTMCVQVCPTGIDIRNGLQYECIACSACIDACDDVMDKMGYDRGLIRYTTDNAKKGKGARILRPRIFVYIVLLAGLMSTIMFNLLTRTPLEMDVIRDRNSLYRETDEGLIENVYTLKVLNMDNQQHTYQLSATGIADLQLKMDFEEIIVPAGTVHEIFVRLQADESDLTGRSNNVDFHLQATDIDLSVTEEARFLGPN